MVLTISVHMTNTCVPISDHCILFVNAPAMFMAYNTNSSNFENLGKITPVGPSAGLVRVNANITLLHGWNHVSSLLQKKDALFCSRHVCFADTSLSWSCTCAGGRKLSGLAHVCVDIFKNAFFCLLFQEKKHVHSNGILKVDAKAGGGAETSKVNLIIW